MCQLCRKCRSLNVAQTHGPLRPVTGIALPFFLIIYVVTLWKPSVYEWMAYEFVSANVWVSVCDSCVTSFIT
jgi:hypothetical protein